MAGVRRLGRVASLAEAFNRSQRHALKKPPPFKGRRGDSGMGWYELYQTEGPEGFKRYRPPTPFDWSKLAAGVVRSRTFFDVMLDKEPAGRIEIELADDVLPLTCTNFRLLCEGKRSDAAADEPPFSYAGSSFNRLIKDAAIVGGHVQGDEVGNHSAFKSRFFHDEAFVIPHTAAGLVSMVSAGVHRNASQFYITTAPCPHLDGRAVAFGRVVKGMEVVEAVSKSYSVRGRPVAPITIQAAGVLVPPTLPEA